MPVDHSGIGRIELLEFLHAKIPLHNFIKGWLNTSVKALYLYPGLYIVLAIYLAQLLENCQNKSVSRNSITSIQHLNMPQCLLTFGYHKSLFQRLLFLVDSVQVADCKG